MDQTITDLLIEAANVMRWLSHDREANALIDLAVICSVRGVRTAEDLSDWRADEEKEG